MKGESRDRRTQRTHQMLSTALVTLIVEKRYDTITVQDIIDRANIGRSTFYKHFYDKDDLLLSNIEVVFDHLSQHIHDGPEEHATLVASRRLFDHVDEYRAVYHALVRSKRIDMVLEAGHRSLKRAIERNLHQTNIVGAVPAAAIAHYLAGSFIALVRWWLDEGGLYTPAHMDDIFQALVAPGLQRALLNES